LHVYIAPLEDLCLESSRWNVLCCCRMIRQLCTGPLRKDLWLQRSFFLNSRQIQKLRTR